MTYSVLVQMKKRLGLICCKKEYRIKKKNAVSIKKNTLIVQYGLWFGKKLQVDIFQVFYYFKLIND